MFRSRPSLWTISFFILCTCSIFFLTSYRATGATKEEFSEWKNLLESAQKHRLCRDGRFYKSLKTNHKIKNPRGDVATRYRPQVLSLIHI